MVGCLLYEVDATSRNRHHIFYVMHIYVVHMMHCKEINKSDLALSEDFLFSIVQSEMIKSRMLFSAMEVMLCGSMWAV